MDLGRNLRQLRDSKNLTQQEVADYVGVDRKTYNNWETGVSDVKSKFIPKLAEFYNVEISSLFLEKSSNVITIQSNTDKKVNSVNGIFILLNNKDAVDEIVKILMKNDNCIIKQFR